VQSFRNGILLGGLKPGISSRADSHKTQQSGAELRHRKISPEIEEEEDAECESPGNHLEAMNGDPIFVTDNVEEKSVRFVLSLLPAHLFQLSFDFLVALFFRCLLLG